jgi:hypothetical protein
MTDVEHIIPDVVWVQTISPPYYKPPAAKVNVAARTQELSLQSVSAADQPIPILYGDPIYMGVRMAGIVADAGGKLHILGILGYGELHGIQGTYADDLLLSGSGLYYGTQTQTVDATIKAAFAQRSVVYNDAMPGIAYVRYTLPTSLDIQGEPNLAVKCSGKKVLDMRTGALTTTAAMASNPVLCLADFITNARYGLGATYDVASFSAAANFCDEVTSDGPRYRMALAMTATHKVDDWLNQLSAYTGCELWRKNGVYFLTILRARAPVLAITKTNIIEGTFGLTLRAQRDLPTRVSVQYTDWTVFPPSTRSAAQQNDSSAGGDSDRESNVSLPGVTLYAMASRIAGRRLNAIWYGQLQASWRAFDAGLNYRPGDVLTLTFPEYGLAGAKFQITGLGDQGFGRWDVKVESYDDAAYSDVALPPPPIVDPGQLVPPENGAPVLLGPITMVEELVEFGNGDFRPRLRVTWPDATGAQTSFYSIAIVDVSNTTSPIVVETSNTPLASYVSGMVVEERTYRARVLAVGINGLTSGYVDSSDVYVFGKTAPPANVQNFVAIEAGGNVYCSWSPVPDKDRDEYEIRRGAVGQAWASMIPVSRLHSTNTVLNSQPRGTVDYAIKAIDTSGNYSTTEARQTVTVTQDQNLNITGPNPFLTYTTSNCVVWTPYGGTMPVMVNTNLAGVWGDGATDPNNNTGTFNDQLKDVVISLPSTAGWMQAQPFDFGTIIGNTRVSCTAPYTLLGGPAVGVVMTTETSTDGTNYTAIGASEMRSVRYVRCRLDIAAGTSIRALQNWTVSLVAVLVTEQGNVTISASGKTTVTLIERYSSWVAIQTTPQGNVAGITSTFDNVVIGTGVTNTFDVWLFKANAPAAGTASWSFRGTR